MTRACLVVCLLLISGCGDALYVHRDNPQPTEGSKHPERIEGIPFYVKTARYKQTTVYEQSWFEVSLSAHLVKDDGTSGEVLDKLILELIDDRGIEEQLFQLRELINQLNKAIGDANEERAAELWTEMENLLKELSGTDYRFDAQTQLPRCPVANSLVQVAVVDYETKYYLNGPLPAFGSANVTTELNADGTLSKATGAPVSSPEKLAELIPFKEFLTAEFISPAPATSDLLPGAAPTVIRFKLQVTKRKHRYEFVHLHKSDPVEKLADNASCTTLRHCPSSTPAGGYCLPPLPFDPGGGQFVRKAVGDATKNPDDGKSVKFSGKVDLPKDE